jgi:hypothetical protein
MEKWYRVFGAGDQEPAPAAILEHLRGHGSEVTGTFGADEAGWFYADLLLGQEVPLRVNRYRSDEAGLRAELNSWAAWVESLDAAPALMERFIQTRQLFTFCAKAEATEHVCLVLAQNLATITDGLYQVDDRGLFSANGTLLLAE